MNKNETIKATLKATKAKHRTQMCRVYETKIDLSHLNHATQEHLYRLFLEAKWFYNYILSQHKIFGMDDKVHEVPVKVKDIFDTFKILDKRYITIQGLKQKLKVIGLKQIPEGADIANGTLIHKNGNYYLSITTYQEKTKQIPVVEKSVGIDFGLSRQLARKLSKQELHSKNWNKTRIKLNKEYDKATNIKQDIKNKVVSFLKDKYGNIQDIALDEQVYVCKNKKCGNIMDRNYNSSINIESEGLKRVGTVRTELTPVEIESSTLLFLGYFNSIPYVKASSVDEPGSFTALA